MKILALNKAELEGPGNKSLEENIEDIQLGLEALYEFKDGTLKDRLVAFQYALTVAHHYGTMADHVLGVQRGRGEQILNALSSGDKVEEWNAELEKVLGHIPGTLSKEIPQLWIDPEAVG